MGPCVTNPAPNWVQYPASRVTEVWSSLHASHFIAGKHVIQDMMPRNQDYYKNNVQIWKQPFVEIMPASMISTQEQQHEVKNVHALTKNVATRKAAVQS